MCWSAVLLEGEIITRLLLNSRQEVFGQQLVTVVGAVYLDAWLDENELRATEG